MPSTTEDTTNAPTAGYVDNSAQTDIQGLAKHPIAVPSELSPPLPQDQQPKDKGKGKATDMTTTAPSLAEHGELTTQTSHLSPNQNLPRKKRPPFNARISLPTPDIDAEGPPSPPPTYVSMSPLPAANRLHAGHTPIVPRSRSPLREPEQEQDQEQDDNGQATPDQDQPLTGALTLPTNPLDGSDDRITVKALDAELEKIAKEQQVEPGSTIAPDADNGANKGVVNGADNGGRGSPDKDRRSSADEVEDIDGVILKKNTKMNMGAPLGQA